MRVVPYLVFAITLLGTTPTFKTTLALLIANKGVLGWRRLRPIAVGSR